MQHYALRGLLHSRKLLKREKKKTQGKMSYTKWAWAQCHFQGVSSKAGWLRELTRKGHEAQWWQP